MEIIIKICIISCFLQYLYNRLGISIVDGQNSDVKPQLFSGIGKLCPSIPQIAQ